MAATALSIIENGPFVEWIAATGGEFQVLISKKDSTLENTKLMHMASWIMTVPLTCIAAGAH